MLASFIASGCSVWADSCVEGSRSIQGSGCEGNLRGPNGFAAADSVGT